MSAPAAERAPPFWIGAGWKMNKTRTEARAWCDALLASGATETSARLFVVPPFTALATVAERLAGSGVIVAAQNMHWEEAGAWTGEISAAMLRDCGATMVELGHSERRRNFSETDGTVALKTAAALRAGLLPLVCVGETAEERDEGVSDAALARQALAALGAGEGEVLFAYEPVWAIGTAGRVAEPAYVSDRCRALKRTLVERTGRRAQVLYGGSVDLPAGAALAAGPEVDGLFVGRAALDAEGFAGLVRAASKARQAATS